MVYHNVATLLLLGPMQCGLFLRCIGLICGPSISLCCRFDRFRGIRNLVCGSIHPLPSMLGELTCSSIVELVFSILVSCKLFHTVASVSCCPLKSRIAFLISWSRFGSTGGAPSIFICLIPL